MDTKLLEKTTLSRDILEFNIDNKKVKFCFTTTCK